MNTNFLLLLFLFIHLIGSPKSIAQTPCNVCGEYYLEGVRETASGFKINPDSTFEFFFSSGALDRYGSGKWQLSLANAYPILLTSDTTKGPALKIINSNKKSDAGISIQINDANPVVNRYFFVMGFSGKDTSYAECNPEGLATLETGLFDSIGVYFEFCPDHTLIFIPEAKKNYFEVKTEPWLFEVIFRNFYLTAEKKRLIGKHPMMKGDFIYLKNQE
ncbi:MAG: hypothetical protein IPN36_07295 [Bacteroidetes bacterium]|nr:hypothetical protein [Bacteroidota bacterium]